MITNLFVTWDIDPALIRIGEFEVRYYGLFWVLAFAGAMVVFEKMLKRENRSLKLIDSAFIYCFLGTIIGARLGHCMFYETSYYLSNPIEILNIRGGGLASHGAALGLLVGMYLFSRKNKLSYMWTLDRITTAIPLSGAFVRLGNLFNSEIYGTQTDMPWGFIFVRSGETLAMHPTQLYEALMYILIFVLLIYMYYKTDAAQKPGVLFGTCLTSIFLSRLIIELIKNPQEQFEQTMVLNMGQLLSIPFIILGVVILSRALILKKK